jgi:hypothetical protein
MMTTPRRHASSPHKRMRLPARYMRVTAAIALACLALPLEGCAAAAFPCRIASATLKIVPLVGHPAAVPFDACAAAID